MSYAHSIQIVNGEHCLLEDLIISLENYVSQLLTAQGITIDQLMLAPSFTSTGPYARKCTSCQKSFTISLSILARRDSGTEWKMSWVRLWNTEPALVEKYWWGFRLAEEMVTPLELPVAFTLIAAYAVLWRIMASN